MSIERDNTLHSDAIVAFYQSAKAHLNSTIFAREADWQAKRDLYQFNESDLLREAAWVILCCGFRESIVRQCFSYISLCFCEWESAAIICKNATLCRTTALSAFKNTRKIDAIIGTAQYVNNIGFETYRIAILQDSVAALRLLPYMGEICACHLAKNLGADMAKPDRHLMRFAAAHGFSSPHELCSEISRATGDSLRVVDIVLWRFLAEKNKASRKSS